MTETTSRTATEAPTVRLVCDLGPGQQINAVSRTLADLTTTMTCLYRFRPYFRAHASSEVSLRRAVPWNEEDVLDLPGVVLWDVATSVFPAAGRRLVVDTMAGPRVLHLSYWNPLEVWLELAQSAVLPGTVLASSALALPRFADFVVNVGSFLRDYGAERRIKIAQARTAEAQADAARALADRTALGRDEVEAIGALRDAVVDSLAEASTTSATRPELEAATESRVSVEDSAAMLRLSGSLREFEDVTGQEPPRVSA